jgi:hypothetical protein
MKNVEVLLEHYRKQLGITEEQEQQFIEEHKAKNPVSLLERRLDGEILILDERAKGMQEIDEFTLNQTFLIDDRTEGMKEIDEFTLGIVFELLARVDVLEQEIQNLKGGK